jgi:aspartate aminotransferase
MKLSPRAANLSDSPTLTITARAKELIAKGQKVINFAAGEPDFDTPSHIKDAAVKAIQAGFTKYTPSIGMLALRESIAAKFKKDNLLDYDSSSIIVTAGAKQALFNAIFALCQDEDEVIIPSPFWVSYPQMVKASGARAIILPTEESSGFKLTPQALEKAITPKTKLLVLNSPSNPTGSVYTEEELKGIAQLLVSSGVFVLSDEIYEKIIYDEHRHISIGSLNESIFKLTITVSGVSKAYSMTGWRIGYLASPVKELIQTIKRIQDHSTSNPASISQKAAQAALDQDQSCLEDMLNQFKLRRDYMMERLDNIKGIKYSKPLGAFYIFCNISRFKMSSVTFAEKLLEAQKVAVIPGAAFGWDTHIRLSFATGMEQIKEGMDRLERWVKKLLYC